MIRIQQVGYGHVERQKSRAPHLQGILKYLDLNIRNITIVAMAYGINDSRKAGKG
jgi:hypothetical protein